jgi:hypothetical protein
MRMEHIYRVVKNISMIIKVIHVIINKNTLSMIMTIDVLAGLTRLYNLIMYYNKILDQIIYFL